MESRFKVAEHLKWLCKYLLVELKEVQQGIFAKVLHCSLENTICTRKGCCLMEEVEQQHGWRGQAGLGR